MTNNNKKKKISWPFKKKESHTVVYKNGNAKIVHYTPEQIERAKKTIAKMERRAKFKKTATRMESGTERVTKGAGRIASGFHKRVIEGKTGVTVRGGTIYPKKKTTKPRYYAKGRKAYPIKKTKQTKKYPHKVKARQYKEMEEYDPFDLYGGAPKKGYKEKKPPMLFDPFG